jgi:hypothetical protein
MDRHLSAWALRWNASSPAAADHYFSYPLSGFAQGCNLGDTLNTGLPFTRLFDSFPQTYLSQSVGDDSYIYADYYSDDDGGTDAEREGERGGGSAIGAAVRSTTKTLLPPTGPYTAQV